MKNKKYIILLTSIFLLVTILGFCTDTTVNKVHFRNQNFVIQQEMTNIKNRDVNISISKTELNNKDAKTNFSDIKPSDSKSHVNIKATDVNSADIFDKTATKLDGMKTLVNNNHGKASNNSIDKYTYSSISWNEWKSNFINKFLDDSLYISSLDDYGLGSWFYYSFYVLDTGKIDKIRVFSLYLNSEDKDKIRDLIQSYAYKDITKFPQNSKRKKAKVEAIVLLGDSETKTKPSDFNDTEKIKVKY